MHEEGFGLRIGSYVDGESTLWYAEGTGRPWRVFVKWLRTQSLGVTHWSLREWCAWTFKDRASESLMRVRFMGFIQAGYHGYGPWHEYYDRESDTYSEYEYDDDYEELDRWAADEAIWSSQIRVWRFRCNSTSPMWCTTSRPRPRSERFTGSGRGWQKSCLRRFSFEPYCRSGKITDARTAAYIRTIWSGRNKGRRLSMS